MRKNEVVKRPSQTTKITPTEKQQIQKAVTRVVVDYGQTLKLLGRE